MDALTPHNAPHRPRAVLLATYCILAGVWAAYGSVLWVGESAYPSGLTGFFVWLLLRMAVLVTAPIASWLALRQAHLPGPFAVGFLGTGVIGLVALLGIGAGWYWDVETVWSFVVMVAVLPLPYVAVASLRTRGR